MDAEEFYKDFVFEHQEVSTTEITDALKFTLANRGAVTTFLDIGCGEGVALREAKELGIPHVTGCDISDKLIQGLRAKGLDAFVVNIDRSDLPVETSSVDLVYCSEVLEHVSGTEHLLEEVLRVLKPGGWCFLTTPNLGFWYNRIILLLGYQPMFAHTGFKYTTGHLGIPHHLTGGHLRLFTYRALCEFVKLIGFEIVKATGLNTFTNPRYKFLKYIFRHPSVSMRLGLYLRKPASETVVAQSREAIGKND